MNHIFASINDAAAARQSRYASNPEMRETVSMTNIDDRVRAAPVRIIHFHGSETGSASRRAIHWRLFLELGGGYSGYSVEFNSQQLQNDLRTRLFVTFRPYISSTNSTVRGTIQVPVAHGVTVGDVLSLVLDKRRDLYRLKRMSILVLDRDQ